MSTPSLHQQLAHTNTATAASLSAALEPKELQVMQRAIDDSKLGTWPQLGHVAPLFTLPNQMGIQTSLSHILQSHKHAVFTFFRGSFCPFCNTALKAHQEALSTYKELNAEFFAISPEIYTMHQATIAKNGLSYALLSDVGNVVTRQYGILNDLPEDLSKIYLKLGISFESAYGASSDHFQFPHPATFVVEAQTGKVVFAHAEVDFKKRAEPSAIIEVLKTLAPVSVPAPTSAESN